MGLPVAKGSLGGRGPSCQFLPAAAPLKDVGPPTPPPQRCHRVPACQESRPLCRAPAGGKRRLQRSGPNRQCMKSTNTMHCGFSSAGICAREALEPTPVLCNEPAPSKIRILVRPKKNDVRISPDRTWQRPKSARKLVSLVPTKSISQFVGVKRTATRYGRKAGTIERRWPCGSDFLRPRILYQFKKSRRCYK